jgi:hypothetical protein
MSAISPVDTALSLGQRIGRYFALVSLIPSLFLVLWAYVLIASGALSGVPKLHNVEIALSHWSIAKAAGVVLASLAVAFVLHPLQLATTQLLEGYWGTSAPAVGAMKIRIIHHRKRQRELQSKAAWSRDQWRNECLRALGERAGADPLEEDQELNVRISSKMKSEFGDKLMLYSIAEQQASNQERSNYPSDPTRILPTQLGNALRSFEDAAGRQYGLDALVIAPHLHLIAPDRHLEYLTDAREDMDSAIRICVVGLVATALTVAFLLTDGLWLLWAILPYFISYLAYKGAVSAAQSYGTIIASVIDLDRFSLYDELGVYLPLDTKDERTNNGPLMKLLGGNYATVLYRQKK